MKRTLLLCLIVCLLLSPCWSEKLANSYIELDIPYELEIQNEAWGEVNDLFTASSSSDSITYRLVLQQRGLNDFETDAFDRYCRVMVTVIDTGVPGYTNKLFKEEIRSCSLNEIEELLDNFEKQIVGVAEVVEHYEAGSITFDGEYALYTSLLRKSASKGKADVYLEGYYFVVNGHLFLITTSYRIDDRDVYASVVEHVISSMKICLTEASYNTGVLHERYFPWISSMKFLWPNYSSWETTTDADGTMKKLSFSDAYHLGFTYDLAVLSSNQAVSQIEQEETLYTFKSVILSELKNTLKNYNVSITKQKITDGILYIDYTYSAGNTKIYGSMYSRFVDAKRFISVGIERLVEDNSYVTSINESLGF